MVSVGKLPWTLHLNEIQRARLKLEKDSNKAGDDKRNTRNPNQRSTCSAPPSTINSKSNLPVPVRLPYFCRGLS